ncbi:homeodomain-interacting protein kinase 1 [Etheostoma spectabile]|uniref:homeodomain-interacting protein kinase 1 n=1 Tax=Etheostoma spectabile TaxID=54343 RepID=UPI0013AF9FBF|nr:homeodomain-interacting protein kinase 1-like [Etheostoma spectabile]
MEQSAVPKPLNDGHRQELSNQPQINTISGNYEILKVLGQGCYGQVVKCFKRDTKETVAVKVLKQRYSLYKDKREVSMLDKLRCLDPDKSNIVRCHEWFHRTDHTFMDMSLHEHMYQKKTVPFAFKWHENPHQRCKDTRQNVEFEAPISFPLWHIHNLTSLAGGHSIKCNEGCWTDPYGFETRQHHAGESPEKAIQGEAH